MQKLLSYIILLLITLCAYSQDKDKVLSVKDMHTDIDYFYNTLKEVHPNPFIVLTEKEWEGKIDSLKKIITSPLSKKDFFLLVSSLNKYVDLHTHIGISDKMKKQRDVAYSLPKCTMINDSVFFRDKNNFRQRITKINNIAFEDIKEEFLNNRNLVEESNLYTFWDIINNFSFYHLLDTNIVIEAVSDSNITSTFVYPPLPTLKKSKNNKNEIKGYRVYHLEMDTVSKIAVFELNTFMPEELKDQLRFLSLMDKVFDTLKLNKIKRLYIDLTYNNGGLIAYEEEVMKHFLKGGDRKLSWDLVIKQSKPRRKQRGPFAAPVSDGDYYQTRRYLNVPYKDNNFSGEVYVIQSRRSFSAASTLASQLQTYANATIIGEECQVKAVYTDPIRLEFPKSKFNFSCSTGFLRNVGKDKLRGVVPDIEYSIDDVTQPISIQMAEEMRTSKDINKENKSKQ
jgi:hypothetical protein